LFFNNFLFPIFSLAGVGSVGVELGAGVGVVDAGAGAGAVMIFPW
jgi:hypothetical protein